MFRKSYSQYKWTYDIISSTNKKRDIPVSIGVGRGISPKQIKKGLWVDYILDVIKYQAFFFILSNPVFNSFIFFTFFARVIQVKS